MGPVAAAAGDSVTFSGHGYGHGRGMGQYGAYGYAVDQGWSYQAILGHYYSNTTLQGVGNPMISVELTRDTGADTIAMGDGLAVNGSAIGAGAVLVRKAGSGVFTVFTAPGCAGPWSVLNPSVGSGLTITDTDGMPTVCESTKTTTYRGSLRVVDAGGTHYTFNDVSTEDYLRGVLPRESPASWGDAGGGRGMQALMAQAVAARSYALAYGGRTSGASICDSESCQVYGGAIERPYSTGVVKTLEDARTNAAVQGTAGVALAMPGGAIARAEFSSSTGGYTAGGTFPAVVDDGDATGQNPNRNWISTIPVGTVASGLGVSSIRSISVTQRNGLGAEGGRVLSVRVVDNAGVTKTLTGNQVRVALGLRSDWFSISWDSPAEAQSVVRAMYMDLLGRGPDPTGLQGWSAALLSGTGQPALVAALTRSDEYIALRVSKAYNEVLGRAPEPAG
ncbi:SpoIID/LytB domain-containing protein, partial [Cellulomonas sp. URHE0023]|uniref:SpoIID/LytB domain-containing protein n=1 Tax=Cellulomonas sp. URHE0023 TaxID=1380354 RepID=UPI000690E3A7